MAVSQRNFIRIIRIFLSGCASLRTFEQITESTLLFVQTGGALDIANVL